MTIDHHTSPRRAGMGEMGRNGVPSIAPGINFWVLQRKVATQHMFISPHETLPGSSPRGTAEPGKSNLPI